MQKDNPLVSIIVPVYNVENYLKRCLDSIIAQSYKNLQVILVDDGSADMSGKICDEYGKNDSRIFVLHKPNGGLSDARNKGLEIAKGELISFIDSDDWVESDMIECLVKGIHLGADMSICGFYTNYSGRKVAEGYSNGWRFEQGEMLMDKVDGMQLLLSDEIPNYAWNKMYKKELFEQREQIRFPAGINYEDVAVMYLLMHRCNKIAFLRKPLYHYEYRATGITGARKTNDFIDHCEIRIERYRWSQTMCRDLCDIQCIGIADVLIRMVAANMRDTFLRKTDRQVRIEDRQKREQLTEKLREMHHVIYRGLNSSWKTIYRLCMMNTWLTDCVAIAFELVRRKMAKKRC